MLRTRCKQEALQKRVRRARASRECDLFYYDRRVLHFLDVGARRELVGLEVGVFYGSGARYEWTRPYGCVLSSFSEGTRPGGFFSHLDRLSVQHVPRPAARPARNGEVAAKSEVRWRGDVS